MRSKIWQRYLLAQFFKVFFLFLAGFFLLYSVLDYSTHMQDFIKDKRIQVTDLFLYYGYQFIKRSDLLLPLALLVAVIKVLTTLNTSRELIALQAAGLRIKTIFRPFFLVALVCSLFVLISEEWILPQSLNYLDKFRETHFRHSFKGKRKDPFFVLHLKDNSKLVYKEYLLDKEIFFDVFWIRSFDDIWRIKELRADPKNPIGKYVDHLTRNNDGFFEKKESFETCRIPTLKWQTNLPRKGIIPMENRKISQLYRLLFVNDATTKYQAGEIATHFYYKIAIPWVSFLALIGISPYCIRYTRTSSGLILYATGVFSLIAFFMLIDACAILGENQKIYPLAAIALPFVLSLLCCGWKYAKLK